MDIIKGSKKTSLKVEWTVTVQPTIRTAVSNVRSWINQQSWDQASEDGSGTLTPSKSTEPDAIAHYITWYGEHVTAPIGGYSARMFWTVRAWNGRNISEGAGIQGLKPLDCFISMYLFEHLSLVTELTNEQLLAKGRIGISP